MFRYINGVLVWQFTQLRDAPVQRALSARYQLMLALVYVGPIIPGLILVILLISNGETIGPLTLPLILSVFGIIGGTGLIMPKIIGKYDRIKKQIVKDAEEYKTTFMTEKNPAFAAIFPAWMVRKYFNVARNDSFGEYLKNDGSRPFESNAIRHALLFYNAAVLWAERLHEEALDKLGPSDELGRIDEKYRFQERLLELAKSHRSVFETEFGMKYGSHFEDELARIKTNRTAEIDEVLSRIGAQIDADRATLARAKALIGK